MKHSLKEKLTIVFNSNVILWVKEPSRWFQLKGEGRINRIKHNRVSVLH